MKYHDNEVCLPVRSNSGYQLRGGNFTITEYSVSKGEDPDGKIYKGLKNNFGSNGKMSFRVGRHGSKDVARWFNSRIKASQNTFNHQPDSLNFAFIGTLELQITGGILGNKERTFVFQNIAIAQGHSGAKNNWWFGGENCTYTGSNTVRCEGICQDGIRFPFEFLRGGNSVNTIDITPKGLSNWLSNINDRVKLSEFMMPGSHDAGMSELSHCNPFVGADPYTRTQSQSIGGQLNNGSRYFDIRVDYDHGELVTYHRSGAYGCNGQKLKSVLDQTVSFLKENRGEFSILKFSHIRNYKDHKASETKTKINQLLDHYAEFIYKNVNTALNLADVNLEDLRGKMLLVFDYSEYIEPAKGRFRYEDGNTYQSNSNITVYDKYSDTADYSKMKENQLEKWEKYADPQAGYLFLLSWTLTSNNPPLTAPIVDLADKANSNLPKVLQEQIIDKKWQRPNIVYIDFINQKTCQAIVSYHFNGVLPLQEKYEVGQLVY